MRFALYSSFCSSRKPAPIACLVLSCTSTLAFLHDIPDKSRVLITNTISKSRILFTGFLSGELLEELYSNAFAFILASSVEGMPLSLLEAMAYGCAVIGSGIEEIREVAGDCGLLYPCKDTKALAACMQRLCDDETLRQTCKTKSLQQIKSRYSWEKIAGKTAALYDALLEETQP